MSTLLALLGAARELAAIVGLILQRADAAEQRGLGRKEAVAEAASAALRDIEEANAARAEAAQRHAADPTDAAFDNAFARKD